MTIAAHHMDNSNRAYNSVNGNNYIVRSTSEVKRELKKLVDLITVEEECRAEVLDKICESAQTLKSRKAEGSASSKSLGEGLYSISIPDCFLCPISSEVMRDPVVLATGQTYDRPHIQAWLDAGHRTCPKTQQVLEHLTLTPNYLVRSMIKQWCDSQGFEPLLQTGGGEGEGITARERQYVAALVEKLGGEHQSQRREAAMELRALTRKKAFYRAYLAQEAEVIPALIPLLLSPDYETQEHAVTTLLNMSIHDANKRLIAEEGAVQPMVEVVRNGSMPARENAAAALFSLSAVEDNKLLIGASGAIPALVELLREGSSRGKKDAASALFNLCISHGNRGRCVRAGVVPILLKLIRNAEEGMADESLAILAIVSANEEGAKAVGDAGAVPLLMQFIKQSSPRNQENAVVILLALCTRDSAYLKQVKCMEAGDGYMALLDLSMSGTSRARRKANALVERINKL